MESSKRILGAIFPGLHELKNLLIRSDEGVGVEDESPAPLNGPSDPGDIIFGEVSFLLGVTGVEELGGRFLALGLGL